MAVWHLCLLSLPHSLLFRAGLSGKSWSSGAAPELREEQVLTALCEAAPSSLLQLYALMVEGPKGNPVLLCFSVSLSVFTVADSLSKSYEVFLPKGRSQEKGRMPGVLLTAFRMCDVFARIGVLALLGTSLRPAGARLQGIQQPYLPAIMLAEGVLVSALFKACLKLQAWRDLLRKEHFIGMIQSFLGTFWCCHGQNLIHQHSFARGLLALRTVEVWAALWLCELAYSVQCASDRPVETAVLTVALASIVAYSVTFILASGHELCMALWAVNLFPVISGWRGGKLELAARYGVASKVRRLLLCHSWVTFFAFLRVLEPNKEL